MAGKLHNFICGQMGAGSVLVDVAADCREGTDCAERVQDRRVTHVPGVEDMVCAAQGGDCSRPQQAVRVGDYSGRS